MYNVPNLAKVIPAQNVKISSTVECVDNNTIIAVYTTNVLGTKHIL